MRIHIDPEYGLRRLTVLPTESQLFKKYTEEYKDPCKHPEDKAWRLLTYGDWMHCVDTPSLIRYDIGAGDGLFAEFVGAVPVEINGAYEKRYNIGFMSFINVLEHVLKPYDFLEDWLSYVGKEGDVLIVVPREDSKLQQALCQPESYVQEDHLTYFTRESILRLTSSFGLELYDELTTFPTELFNGDPAECHHKRKVFETLMSRQQRIEFYRALAKAEMGRNMVLFFRKT